MLSYSGQFGRSGMLQTVLTSALFLSMPGVLTKTPPSKSPLGVPGRNALVSVIVVSPSITRASPGLASCSRVSVGVPLQASQNKAKAAASTKNWTKVKKLKAAPSRPAPWRGKSTGFSATLCDDEGRDEAQQRSGSEGSDLSCGISSLNGTL